MAIAPRRHGGCDRRLCGRLVRVIGAADSFIAKQFQAHFIRLGSRGAAIGGTAAALFFALSSLVSSSGSGSAGGEEIAALFGAFALSPSGYAAIFAICVAIAALTGFLSRLIVFGHLRTLL
jgi:cell division transport system permease protein